MALATSELIWLQSLLQELHISILHNPIFVCDNVSAKHLSIKHMQYSCMKHVVLDWHFLQDQVNAGTFDVKFMPTKD